MTTYKSEHELFVSDGSGTSVLNVLACLSHAPPLIYLLQRWQANHKSNIMIEIVLISLPALISLTLLADHQIPTLFVLYTSFALLSTIYPKCAHSDQIVESAPTRKSYLTLFKGILFAISAPNFPSIN